MQRAAPSRSLASVVGPDVYAVWLAMLKSLIPHGRTHRLAVVVAGMLHHAADVAQRTKRRSLSEESVAASLLAAAETDDPEELGALLGDVVATLFRDAKVAAGRASARGKRYSIADAALQEFAAWDDMPWG